MDVLGPDPLPEQVALPIRAAVFARWAAAGVVVAALAWARVTNGGGAVSWLVAGLATLVALKMTSQYFQSRGGELRLSPEGFRDTRYLLEPVPWSEVADARAVGPRLRVTFTPDSPNRFGTGARHWHEVSRRASGAPSLQVSTQAMDMDAGDLAMLVERFRERHAGN